MVKMNMKYIYKERVFKVWVSEKIYNYIENDGRKKDNGLMCIPHYL